MARMHSRRKGKSGSKKPATKENPKWLAHSPKEVEQLVVKSAKSIGSQSPSKLGEILRDSYGIPDVKKITMKKIITILKENKMPLALPEDLSSLIKKEIKIIKHIEKNKKDIASKHRLHLTESKIRRLTKYYKRKEVLPKEWKYSKEQAKLIVE